MVVEKEGSKSGGYVGGFFQLFDWTAKSRKKLFSSKSDFPERSKQGKRSVGNLPMTRVHLMDEDENGAGSSIRGSSDYSCASSVTDDDGYGAKAPGVVARLMGLDSLPTSSFPEPNSTPFFDTQSLQDAARSKNHFDYYHDHQLMYSGNLLNKEDDHHRNFVKSKPQKVISRPIEKFQTEILPPKSAKSIPITHHKLLSPIKSPGFIQSKTAAHIMEAAAKIIESSPQAASKTKMHTVRPSSVPLKVRDLKEKLEVAQKIPLSGSSSGPLKVRHLKEKVETSHKTSRPAEASRRPVESSAAKYLKGQSLNKSWNGTVDTIPSRAFPEAENGSSLKDKGKSISLAIQAKVNVQRRESLNSSSSRGFAGQKEQTEAISGQVFKSQRNIQKSVHKKSPVHNASGVLRQNHQKQNCPIDKDKISSKSPVSNLPSRKVVSKNLSSGRIKPSGRTVGSKVGARKLGSEVTDSEKEITNCSSKNNPRKKRSIDGNLHFEKNHAVDSTLVDNNRGFQYNKAVDGHFSWTEESKKKGMDVVSFTFTAPLTRPMAGSETPGHIFQKNSCMNDRGKRLLIDIDSTQSSSMGNNVIGGDALSILLEKKLQELTDSVETSYRNSVKTGSPSGSESILQDLASTHNAGGTALRLYDNKNQNVLPVDKIGNNCGSDLFSSDPSAHRLKRMFQGTNDMEECSSEHDGCRESSNRRRPSPVSVLEPSFSTESSSSLSSTYSAITEGSNQCSSMHAQEVPGFSSSKKFYFVDAEMELSDSASSTSTGTMPRNCASTLIETNFGRPTNGEMDYVKMITCNLDLMFRDFALGRACQIINPHLFDQLESRKHGFQSDGAEARLERKLLFDCVSECLDLRCRRYIGGGYRTWEEGVAKVRRKEWLANQVYKEISGFQGLGDCMVDELVVKDMSNQYGRWVEFEAEEFVVGVEIESQIFNSLVNEVISDIYLF